jgi:hypothetical protein
MQLFSSATRVLVDLLQIGREIDEHEDNADAAQSRKAAKLGARDRAEAS